MDVPNNLTYRQGVNGIVFNKKFQYLILQKDIYKENQWDFPGGGINNGETPENALYRELNEETGSNKFEILYKVSFKYTYNYPDDVILDIMKNNRKHLHRGQSKDLFMVLFNGISSEIKPRDNIRRVKWVNYEKLKDNLIFNGQWDVYKRAIQEYKCYSISNRDNLLD